MLNKTHVVAVLAVVSVLLGSLFVDNVILAQTGGGEYDPWIDLNDDGDIDADDLYLLANEYGTSGEPINKTALLLELQDKVKSLNTTLLQLQSEVASLERAYTLGADSDSFRYFEYASDYVLKDYPAGSGSYIVPRTQQVVFGIRLTNYDPSGSNRSLTLNSHSLLWMYYPAVGKQVYWYIVNVSANGTISPTYSDITIGYRETTYVYFASASDGTFTGLPDKQKPGTVGPAAINLLLLGTIGSDYYGQNISFVSVYCT